MRPTRTIAIAVFLVTFLLVTLGACAGRKPTAKLPGTAAPVAPGGPVTVEADDAGGKYTFEPDKITAIKGSPLKVTAKNVGEQPHTFTVDAKQVDLVINKGESAEAEMTFDEAGDVRFVCRFHEALGQVGTITVVES